MGRGHSREVAWLEQITGSTRLRWERAKIPQHRGLDSQRDRWSRDLDGLGSCPKRRSFLVEDAIPERRLVAISEGGWGLVSASAGVGSVGAPTAEGRS